MNDREKFLASFGGGSRRRMFTMNCTRHAKTHEDMETLRSYLSRYSPGARDIVTTAGMYFPNMLDTADEARMAHLRQGAQVHDELFPHLARSVKSESEPFRGTMI